MHRSDKRGDGVSDRNALSASAQNDRITPATVLRVMKMKGKTKAIIIIFPTFFAIQKRLQPAKKVRISVDGYFLC